MQGLYKLLMSSRENVAESKMAEQCPECGALWPEGKTCQDYSHQMLSWEFEHSLLDVHHLMVLCYHLQHPSLYSPEGLLEARRLLNEFVERGASPQEVRRRNRSRVDSGKRDWKIKGTAASHGSFARPVHWAMTAADVTKGGPERYYENVQKWARSVHKALQR
jgi:hypothetical protein